MGNNNFFFGVKNTHTKPRKEEDDVSPIISQTTLSVAMETRFFYLICRKTLCSLSPYWVHELFCTFSWA